MEKLVSLIIPIYNEEDSVEILVNEILSLEKEFSFDQKKYSESRSPPRILKVDTVARDLLLE